MKVCRFHVNTEVIHFRLRNHVNFRNLRTFDETYRNVLKLIFSYEVINPYGGDEGHVFRS